MSKPKTIRQVLNPSFKMIEQLVESEILRHQHLDFEHYEKLVCQVIDYKKAVDRRHKSNVLDNVRLEQLAYEEMIANPLIAKPKHHAHKKDPIPGQTEITEPADAERKA